MAQIIPAIIARDFGEIKKKIALVEGLAEWAQIDIVDGLFASAFTWERSEDLLELDGKIKIEVHLMVEQPEHYLANWLRVADRIIVHVEATEKLPQIIEQFRSLPVKLGIAALLETPLEKVTEFVGQVDLVQLMSIEKIGRPGETFAPAAVERVRDLRSRWPDVTISVDGGINLENGEALVAAGADNLVIGSAIWESEDVKKTILEFQKL